MIPISKIMKNTIIRKTPLASLLSTVSLFSISAYAEADTILELDGVSALSINYNKQLNLLKIDGNYGHSAALLGKASIRPAGDKILVTVPIKATIFRKNFNGLSSKLRIEVHLDKSTRQVLFGKKRTVIWSYNSKNSSPLN